MFFLYLIPTHDPRILGGYSVSELGGQIMKKRFKLHVNTVKVSMEGGKATKYILDVYPATRIEEYPIKTNQDGINEEFAKAMNTFDDRKKNTRVFIEWEEDE